MKYNQADLDQQLVSLKKDFAQLGAKLSQAARDLRDNGTPPSDELLEELAAARMNYTHFRGRMFEHAESYGFQMGLDPLTHQTPPSQGKQVKILDPKESESAHPH
ncbi:MAG: hypothetical protein O7E52_21705 [Candidatus Poribacteria bacterium]|nr:hypothetical protein [Candidatus Poribacteria bacterium]